jgi:hypothetical protein
VSLESCSLATCGAFGVPNRSSRESVPSQSAQRSPGYAAPPLRTHRVRCSSRSSLGARRGTRRLAQAEQSEARKKQQSLAMLFKDDAGGAGAGAGAANPSSNAAAGSQPFGLRTDSDSAAGTGTGQSGAAAAKGSSGHFTFNFEIAPKGTPEWETTNNCSAAAGGFKFNFFG